MAVAVFSPLARAVFEALPDAVFVFDAAGLLVYTNAHARALAGELTNGAPDTAGAAELLPQLDARGARVAPLVADGTALGSVAFVPAAGRERQATLAERERRAIVETLTATGWRLTESARRLGISRTTLWRRLNTYGLAQREQRD